MSNKSKSKNKKKAKKVIKTKKLEKPEQLPLFVDTLGKSLGILEAQFTEEQEDHHVELSKSNQSLYQELLEKRVSVLEKRVSELELFRNKMLTALKHFKCVSESYEDCKCSQD